MANNFAVCVVEDMWLVDESVGVFVRGGKKKWINSKGLSGPEINAQLVLQLLWFPVVGGCEEFPKRTDKYFDNLWTFV